MAFARWLTYAEPSAGGWGGHEQVVKYGGSTSRHQAGSCGWLVGVAHDFNRAPGELGAVGSPDALAPVAVAAGLRGQQVEQRVTIPGLVAVDAPGKNPLVEEGTGLLHGHEHRV